MVIVIKSEFQIKLIQSLLKDYYVVCDNNLRLRIETLKLNNSLVDEILWETAKQVTRTIRNARHAATVEISNVEILFNAFFSFTERGSPAVRVHALLMIVLCIVNIIGCEISSYLYYREIMHIRIENTRHLS